jgi:hypothetical protein
MRAHYGYKDGSEKFMITIDTDRCETCDDWACATACPEGVLEIIEDDCGEDVCAVSEEHRRQISESCATCKPATGWTSLPCTDACSADALRHSW